MKTMEHHNGTDIIIGGACGLIGGVIKFFSVYMLDVSYWLSLVKAGGTALVCGFLGVAGKYAFSWCKDKWYKK
jgi:hypothetical protein